VNENSDEGDSTMLAEIIPFEIPVECTGRRDRGKASSSGTEDMRVGVDAEENEKLDEAVHKKARS